MIVLATVSFALLDLTKVPPAAFAIIYPFFFIRAITSFAMLDITEVTPSMIWLSEVTLETAGT